MTHQNLQIEEKPPNRSNRLADDTPAAGQLLQPVPPIAPRTKLIRR
jgi:hypothetical protein